jgi:hypothetical protein
VGEVLSDIDGGRAKIKDVVGDINLAFLAHNPDGWDTKNPQKRDPTGGFTVPALKKIGKAAPPANPDRWSMKPTFYVAADDEMVLLGDDSDNEQTQ